MTVESGWSERKDSGERMDCGERMEGVRGWTVERKLTVERGWKRRSETESTGMVHTSTLYFFVADILYSNT